jgi:hypothetical protein
VFKGVLIPLFLFIGLFFFIILNKNSFMDFINLNSNRGVVNLLSDFILIEINENENHDTIIEVSDFGRFFVINGMTSRKDVVNISEITDKFKNQYESLLTSLGYDEINVIDLIIYGNELTKKDEYWFTYHRTERPYYSDNVIKLSSTNLNYQKISDEFIELDFSEKNTADLGVFTYTPLTISSEFPHGYSYNMGRKYYYYSEYICNHLFAILMCDKITFKCSDTKNSNDDYNIDIITNSIYNKETILSLVLDVFDFDLCGFKNKISDYNYIDDLTKPFDNKPWLVKDEIRNMLIF